MSIALDPSPREINAGDSRANARGNTTSDIVFGTIEVPDFIFLYALYF